jgi:SAM-dependent methyltransferase
MGRPTGAAPLQVKYRAMTLGQNPDLPSTISRCWKEGLTRSGFLPTARSFATHIREFLWESTPGQRRRRYGDAEYDWDYRGDTTSATVGWRERLLGHFHSPYQPTEPALFREMIANLKIDFQEFTFIDIGAGKGRTLLMAADYPFRRILGIELLPVLYRVSQKNLSSYKSDSQQCFAVEAMCGDARGFVFPIEPLVLYLFNPLPEAGMIDIMNNLVHSLSQYPRVAYLLYRNPLFENVLARYPAFNKIAGTPQYSIFRAIS